MKKKILQRVEYYIHFSQSEQFEVIFSTNRGQVYQTYNTVEKQVSQDSDSDVYLK